MEIMTPQQFLKSLSIELKKIHPLTIPIVVAKYAAYVGNQMTKESKQPRKSKFKERLKEALAEQERLKNGSEKT